jgi:HAD superfamily hydrolase (TIGR01509 family)
MDLDGTLYHQGPLRLRMLAELCARSLALGPARARALARRLSCFRRVREELRALGHGAQSLATLQYSEPARLLGEPVEEVERSVREWMHERPLAHLARYRRMDLESFLRRAHDRGLVLGVFSDYPAEDKLAALGLRGAFDVVLAATDEDVNAFKPHPRGFEVACARMGLAPEQVLYVGDRADVDGRGARAAGMPVTILTAQLADDGFHYRCTLAEIARDLLDRSRVGQAPRA